MGAPRILCYALVFMLLLVWSETLAERNNLPSVGAAICRQGQNIESILQIGETEALVGKKRIPISKWRPEGLSQRFTKDFFQTRKLPQSRVMSTIVTKPMRGNQNDIINEQCFIMPIRKYERDTGNGIITVTARDRKDCIEFQALTEDVFIVLVWYSGDDLDLLVTEPDRTVLSQDTVESRNSICGKHRKDNGVGACEFFEFSREVVQYNFSCPEFQNGMYKATIRHAANCGEGPTDWELYVVVKGRTQKVFKGTSNKRDGGIAKRLTFSLRKP